MEILQSGRVALDLKRGSSGSSEYLATADRREWSGTERKGISINSIIKLEGQTLTWQFLYLSYVFIYVFSFDFWFYKLYFLLP